VVREGIKTSEKNENEYITFENTDKAVLEGNLPL
jgi:hypothetical protein